MLAGSYCFGAPYVCDELAGNTVSAGAFGHPAFLNEHHFENLKSVFRLLSLYTLLIPTNTCLQLRASISLVLGCGPHVRHQIQTARPRNYAESEVPISAPAIFASRAWILVTGQS